MIDEMSKARGSAPGKQNLTECFKRQNFLRLQYLKRYLPFTCFLWGKLYLAAANIETQQADAAIANKCTS